MLAAALLFGQGLLEAAHARPAERLSVDTVIAWLPVDMESLIVANGPMDIATTTARSSNLPTDLVRMFSAMAAGGIAGGDNEEAFSPLKGAHLRFAVEGARGFRWSVFAVRLRPEVIVVTTSQEMLEQLLDRSTTPQTSRAFPPQLPEWSGVDRTAPVWAIRHYATSGNELDATTPLAAENRGANVVDPMAVGVAFSIHAGPAGRVVVVYYSRNPRALALMQEYWSDPGDHATLQAGPTSIRVTLSRPNDPSLVGLRLLMLVGHAVFI